MFCWWRITLSGQIKCQSRHGRQQRKCQSVRDDIAVLEENGLRGMLNQPVMVEKSQRGEEERQHKVKGEYVVVSIISCWV